MRLPALRKRKASAQPLSARRQPLPGRVAEQQRTRAQPKASVKRAENRQKRAAPQPELAPAKRLRSSSAVKAAPETAGGPATSQQASSRPRRATLAPLANGVVPTPIAAAAVPEQPTARGRNSEQVGSPERSHTGRQPASGRRRLQRQPMTSDGVADGDAARNFAELTLSEPASSPDRAASGPANATRRARLLQQQIGCAIWFFESQNGANRSQLSPCSSVRDLSVG